MMERNKGRKDEIRGEGKFGFENGKKEKREYERWEVKKRKYEDRKER